MWWRARLYLWPQERETDGHLTAGHSALQPGSRERWMSMSASSFPSFYSDLDASLWDGAISIQGRSSLLGTPAQTHPECLLGDFRVSSADNEEELSQECCTIFGINVYIKQIPESLLTVCPRRYSKAMQSIGPARRFFRRNGLYCTPYNLSPIPRTHVGRRELTPKSYSLTFPHAP